VLLLSFEKLQTFYMRIYWIYTDEHFWIQTWIVFQREILNI